MTAFTCERYIFKGVLVLDTALHVGSGEGDERTDACVAKVRRFDNGMRIPVIPGSSLKGALRSHVERLAAALGLDTCLLSEDSGSKCLTVNEDRRREYLEAVEKNPSSQEGLLRNEGLLQNEGYHLCLTCRLFGSPFKASKVRVRDLALMTELPELLPVRHGVGIDRDTGAAKHGIKFDFEYVPPQARFSMELVVEDPENLELPLLCMGLREMELGNVDLGGNVTRGVGKCHLELESIWRIDPSDKGSYLKYLIDRQPVTEGNIKSFMKDNIERLFNGGDSGEAGGGEGVA